MNRILLSGNIYKNPILITTKNQQKYFKVGIITSDSLKRFITLHFPLKWFALAKSLKHGDLVHLQGKLITYMVPNKNVFSYYVSVEKMSKVNQVYKKTKF